MDIYSLYSTARRLWRTFFPPQPPKATNVIRFGLLGASKIAPNAIINPARSHSEVLIAAVAARDSQRAQAYAKKYDIPIIHACYENLLNDPSIDAVYIPLPNGLHYEWALKALKAGKHVLLEKPSVNNAEEARLLFNHPILRQSGTPVLLEAFHYRFHPAWLAFLCYLDPPSIERASAVAYAPKGIAVTSDHDIRFKYDLGGGTLMDFGSYPVNFLRQVFGTEPEACTKAMYDHMPATCNEPEIDANFTGEWRFPNGGVGELHVDLRATGGWVFPWLTQNWPRFSWPILTVIHTAKNGDNTVVCKEGEIHTIQRTATMLNPFIPTIYHKIKIEDTHIVRREDNGVVLKQWADTKEVKAYSVENRVGEEWWTTYRHQLEEFVNHVRGRTGSGIWVTGDDSIKQMEMIDSGYQKAGLKLRPTSAYR